MTCQEEDCLQLSDLQPLDVVNALPAFDYGLLAYDRHVAPLAGGVD